MKTKKWLIIILLLLLVNVVTLVFLWVQYRTHKRPMEGMATKDFIVKEVGLSQEQQLLYDTMRKAHQLAIKSINREERNLHDDMFETVVSVDLDSSYLNSLILKISELNKEKERVTVFHFRQLRSIMNAEQRQKFDKILKDVIKMIGKPMPPHGRPHKEGEAP